ncbi:MAG: RluA family pseudouridine synthase [Clostridiaceae bacterium]|nr:RluA family pseudouridine synthase [Clostridiaceae bacterium]
MTNEHFIISEAEEGRRLDVWLSEKMNDVSRNYIQKLISEGLVTVDNKTVKSGLKIKKGMNIKVGIPDPEMLSLEPENIPLDIIYEDQSIIVINKSKDMVIHPAAGNWSGTLVNALLAHCKDSLSDINGVIRPGIVHRIDKDTTGLLVVAKNNDAHLKLSEQIKNHSMKRTYEAIVNGIVKEDSGKIDAPIGRHPINRKKMAVVRNGKPAVTYFKILEHLRGHTYLRLNLETGRTHQIRVHMAAMGHPVVGDTVYGKNCTIMDTKGQVLHARFLTLVHPQSNKEMTFEAPLPDYFTDLLERLR